MLLRIKPIMVGKYIDPCLLEFKSEQKDSDFYPSAIVHVDTFWQGRDGNNEVHNALLRGEVVDLEIVLKPYVPLGSVCPVCQQNAGTYTVCSHCNSDIAPTEA